MACQLKHKNPSSLTDNIGTAGQLTGRHQVGETQTQTQVTCDMKDMYPDLYLPVIENFRISDTFYGYSDSLSLITTQWYWWN